MHKKQLTDAGNRYIVIYVTENEIQRKEAIKCSSLRRAKVSLILVLSPGVSV